MSKILTSLSNTIIVGIVGAAMIALISIQIEPTAFGDAQLTTAFFFRWLHVISGMMWIGLLWYFNFVQIPNMSKIPDEQKPAIGKVIAPAALFWFRWAAVGTLVTGVLLAIMNGYLVDALLLGVASVDAPVGKIIIGLGMWIGIIMAFNVWFVIWPNQKIALGIIDAPAEQKAKSARLAMLFSRTNTLLSIPMLFCMVSAGALFGAS